MAPLLKFPTGLSQNSHISELIYRINIGYDSHEELVFSALVEIFNIKDKVKRSLLLGICLNGLLAKKPSLDEAKGAVRASLSLDKTNIDSQKQSLFLGHQKIVCVSGSGKKGIPSFNVSSCASIVAAAGGAFVAKTCSAGVSSLTGSADLMEILGANLELEPEQMLSILKVSGLGFFKIEKIIPNFNAVYGGMFLAPNILSLGFAGLVLPFRADFMLFGLSHPNVLLSSNLLNSFGYNNNLVYTSTHDGIHFIDEITPFGNTNIVGYRNGIIGRLADVRMADMLGLPCYDKNDIAPGNSPIENAKIVINILLGKGIQSQEDIVCINAGTILYMSGIATDIQDGFAQSKRIINSGAALSKLIEFVKTTSGNTGIINTLL